MLTKASFFAGLINRILVSSHYVPKLPVIELDIDCERPIMYVVEQGYSCDLLGLQESCQKAGLPDPYLPIMLNGEQISAVVFIHAGSLFTEHSAPLQDAPYLTQYQQLLDLHQAHQNLDVQLIPVTFYWGRNPGRVRKQSLFNFTAQGTVGLLHKSAMVLTNGREHLVRFNPPISIKNLSLRGQSKAHAYKLAKVAMRYFAFQKRSVIGPKLANRKEMIEVVLRQATLRKVIQEAAQSSSQNASHIEEQCRGYLNEISANFSYSFLRVFRLFLKGLWNFIYQGIEVHHSEAVRQACQSGAEIIYMPCHRSHMDYLLISYSLFEQGLVPPHIAAGVNLNFFPIGSIFRRSGAFFLRRSFKDNPLYTQVFNAYFSMLFKQGYPIEFFCEGGRSRTGLLLAPKTGLLSASLKTYLKQPERNVIIVPIYIGYDHIMEVSTYVKEQAGQKKESESIWQMLGSVKKLGNFGRAFVNFGEPINVKQHFDHALPNWRKTALSDIQFKEQVATIAHKVMVQINEATAVNALPLCAAVLLAGATRQLAKKDLIEQLNCHQQWLALNDETSLVTYEKETGEFVLARALQQNKFQLVGNVIEYSRQQALVLNYYRNNIVHLFLQPSLIFHALRHLQAKKLPMDNTHIINCCAHPYLQLQKTYFLSARLVVSELVFLTLKRLLALNWLVEKSGQYFVVDNNVALLMQGHLDDPFNKTNIKV
ncbi:MAG: glycerol-3-phosphate 1-O-acyltransferase PlsB [Psychromonas sp.]